MERKMKYLVGEILENHIKSTGEPFRRYAMARGMTEVECWLIRRGERVASAKKLNTLVDLEIFEEPLKNEIATLLNDLDAVTLIEMYNVIYNRLELGKYAIGED